jgi:hypothetical protein
VQKVSAFAWWTLRWSNSVASATSRVAGLTNRAYLRIAHRRTGRQAIPASTISQQIGQAGTRETGRAGRPIARGTVRVTSRATIVPSILELTGIAGGEAGGVAAEEKSAVYAWCTIGERSIGIQSTRPTAEIRRTNLALSPCRTRVIAFGTNRPAHLQQKVRRSRGIDTRSTIFGKGPVAAIARSITQHARVVLIVGVVSPRGSCAIGSTDGIEQVRAICTKDALWASIEEITETARNALVVHPIDLRKGRSTAWYATTLAQK